MVATTVQEVSATKSGIQCRRIKEQARGYPILHGFGGPNGAAEKEHEVLPDGPGPAEHNLGLPMVRGDATQHRLG